MRVCVYVYVYVCVCVCMCVYVCVCVCVCVLKSVPQLHTLLKILLYDTKKKPTIIDIAAKECHNVTGVSCLQTC